MIWVGDTSEHEPHDDQTTHTSPNCTPVTRITAARGRARPCPSLASHPSLHTVGTCRRPLHPHPHLPSQQPPHDYTPLKINRIQTQPLAPGVTKRASATGARSHSAPRPTSRTTSWDGGQRPVALGGLQRAVSGLRMAAKVAWVGERESLAERGSKDAVRPRRMPATAWDSADRQAGRRGTRLREDRLSQIKEDCGPTWPHLAAQYQFGRDSFLLFCARFGEALRGNRTA